MSTSLFSNLFRNGSKPKAEGVEAFDASPESVLKEKATLGGQITAVSVHWKPKEKDHPLNASYVKLEALGKGELVGVDPSTGAVTDRRALNPALHETAKNVVSLYKRSKVRTVVKDQRGGEQPNFAAPGQRLTGTLKELQNLAQRRGELQVEAVEPIAERLISELSDWLGGQDQQTSPGFVVSVFNVLHGLADRLSAGSTPAATPLDHVWTALASLPAEQFAALAVALGTPGEIHIGYKDYTNAARSFMTELVSKVTERLDKGNKSGALELVTANRKKAESAMVVLASSGFYGDDPRKDAGAADAFRLCVRSAYYAAAKARNQPDTSSGQFWQRLCDAASVQTLAGMWGKKRDKAPTRQDDDDPFGR